MSIPISIQARVDEVKSVINAGRPFLGGAFIDEQAFFIGTTRLKKALPEVLIGVEHAARGTINVIGPLDELEAMIVNGKGHMFGKVSVDKQACLKQIANVEAALHADLKQFEQLPPTPETEDERIVAQASSEAARVLDEARQEAQRILKEARDKAALGIE